MTFVTSLTLEELTSIIELSILKALSHTPGIQTKKDPSKEYLTRKEVAGMLSITLPTLHKFSLNGRIKAYRIGSRVLYKPNEVESALSSFQKYNT